LVLLPRACLGFGDDVLLLQQPPDSPRYQSSETDQQPGSRLQTFTISASNDDDLPTKQHLALPTVESEENATTVSLGADLGQAGPIFRQAGEGQCMDSAGALLTPFDTVPGLTYNTCARRCYDTAGCQSCDFLKALVNVRVLSTCRLFTAVATKSSTVGDMYCFFKYTPPSTEMSGPPVTATGDPHLKNLNGDSFDVRRPGNHTFLVAPFGANEGNANLYVWADVTPLNGNNCNNKNLLFITELMLTGSWLRPIGTLRLSTRTKEFNTPSSWGLRIGGSTNLSVGEFSNRLPPRLGSITKTHPSKHRHSLRHVDTLLLHLNVGPGNLTIGWAHSPQPASNWLWISIDGLRQEKLGGLLGYDDHEWVTIRPESCAKSSSKAEGP